VRRTISGLLEQFRDRHLAQEQMRVVHVILQDAVDARSQVLPPGDQGCPRRRADRCAGMKVGEPNPSRREFIQRGRLHRPAVTANVHRTQIVRK
jgi:hypothetical protein